MITSMTGYGRAECIWENNKLTVEIKSLNHRFLEVYVRLPNSVNILELDIKKKITERISRGRIEVTVRMDSDQDNLLEPELELNRPLIRKYYDLLTQIRQEFALKDEVTLDMIAGLKDAIISADKGVDSTVVWKKMEGVVDEALNSLIVMRQKEGDSLYQDLSLRVGLIGNAMSAIKARSPQVVMEYQKRLTDRVKELTAGIPLDEARLAQEVAIMAEKSDIMEEIVRFDSHMDQLKDMLKGSEPIGRKLDFLLQEMNREVNTIGSKTNDSDISRIVVEVKSELSRVREQIQNIE